MSQEIPLHHAFIARARQWRKKTAIIDRTTERRITYGKALGRALPPSADCCVVELHDPVKGARLAAAVTVDIDEQAVLKELAVNLPRIAVPSRFIRFNQLPRMGSGKVDFRATADMVRERLNTTAP